MSGNGNFTDVELKQQLIYMQMSIKEIGAGLCSVDRKVDTTNHSINSIEQKLLQMKQLQIFAKMDKDEMENMVKRNIQEAVDAFSSGRPTKSDLGPAHSPEHLTTLHNQHTESFKKLEEGMTALLEKHAPATQEKALSKLNSSELMLGPTPEGKAGSFASSDLRDFQMSLMTDLETRQESLMMFLRDFKLQQEYEFQNLKALSAMPVQPITPTMYPNQTRSQGFEDFSKPQPALQAGGDVGLTPRAEGTPRMDPTSPVQAMAPVSSPVQPAQWNPAAATPEQKMPMQTLQLQPMSWSGNAGSASSSMPAMAGISEVAPQPDTETVLQKAAPPLAAPPLAAPHKPQDEDSDDDVLHESLGKSIELKEDSSLAAVFCCDDDVEAPAYNVEDFYWDHGINQKIARSNFFANFTVFVVVVNAVYIGFDSDYNTEQNIYDAHWVFIGFSQFFALYFTWELVVRLLAFRHVHDCLKDGWFKFDTFLVSTMILDIWVLMPVLFSIGGGVKIPTQPLRMLRLFKLTRMARLMKAFPELVIMIKGLVRSLRAISSSMILIGLMVYVWAIMMHMLMKEERVWNDTMWSENMLGFATITKCIWTLLMAGTLMLDNAAPLMTELLFSGKFNFVLAGIFFVIYSVISAMLILQMLIGVLCDVVSRVGSEQRDGTAIGLVKQELLGDLRQFDGGDGKISQDELKEVMHNSSSRALLKRLDINRAFLLELQKMMFTKPGQQVTIKSVLELMIMCRGDNPTTVQSMAGGLLSIIRELSDVRKELESNMGALQNNIIQSVMSQQQHSMQMPQSGPYGWQQLPQASTTDV